jgi:hypothetical protein
VYEGCVFADVPNVAVFSFKMVPRSSLSGRLKRLIICNLNESYYLYIVYFVL